VTLLSLRGELKKTINDFRGRFVLYQKLNTYTPFLINITVNYCEEMKKGMTNPVLRIFYNLVQRYSTSFHRCPFKVNFKSTKTGVAYPNWSLSRIEKIFSKISTFWATFRRKQEELIQNIEKSLTFDPSLGRRKFFLGHPCTSTIKESLRITVLDLYALVYEISLTIWFLFSGP
jgi:hypothetical protein